MVAISMGAPGGVAVLEAEGEGELLAVSLTVGVPETVDEGVLDAVGGGVPSAVGEWVPVPVGVGALEEEAVGVALGVPVALGEPVGDPGDCVSVPVGDGVALALTVEVKDEGAPGKKDAVGVAEVVALEESVREAKGDPVPLAVGVGDGVAESVAVVEPVPVSDGGAVILAVGVPGAADVTDADTPWLTLGVGVAN